MVAIHQLRHSYQDLPGDVITIINSYCRLLQTDKKGPNSLQKPEKLFESLCSVAEYWYNRSSYVYNNEKVLKKHFVNPCALLDEILVKSYNGSINNKIVIPDLLRMAECYSKIYPSISLPSDEKQKMALVLVDEQINC